MMQQLHFGKIENLIVTTAIHFRARAQDHSGDKTWAGFGPLATCSMSTLSLKSQVVDLFRQFDLLKNESIVTMSARHGLPFRLIVGAGCMSAGLPGADSRRSTELDGSSSLQPVR